MNIFTRLVLIGLTTFCLAAGASAATFVVNTTSDTADANLGNGACADASANCSLRAAISEANALAGPDVITLNSQTYTQSLVASEENLNAGGDWDITSDITINGISQGTTIIQGGATTSCAAGGRERVLEVRPGGNLSLTNATVRHGCSHNVAPPPGGGIANWGVLTLTDVTVRDNSAVNFEGGASGGGIFNSGTALTLINSTITGNSVTGSSPGFGGVGGGVASFSVSPIVITNSSISGNTATGGGALASGGGFFVTNTSSLTVTDSHFDNNILTGPLGTEGGGLYASSSSGSSTLNFTNCTFNNNSRSGAGSSTGLGIRLATATSTAATLSATFDKITVDGNISSNAGAGISLQANGGGLGLTVRNSTISNNASAAGAGGVLLSNNGGLPQSTVFANFYNSTLSGNSATAGGALSTAQVSAEVVVTLDYCTITNNSATNSAGGLSNFSNGTINIARTIVAGNTAPLGPDIFPGVNSFDYNHIGDLSGATITGSTGHNTTGNAMLGALQDNGGPTLTHLPVFGSPVLNSIPNGQGGCGSPSFLLDQRGLPRPSGAACDRGSTERTVYAAGPWSLSGVVRTTTGMPIRNAAVTISGGALSSPITVFTGNFGTYQFTNLIGEEYTVSVSVKRYHFNEASRVFGLGSDITDADFIANAPFGREVFK